MIFVDRVCNSYLTSTQEYFAGNYTERWEEAFDTVDNALANISLYLSCFDFDKFVGVRSEKNLEVEGMRLIEENKLWAGLVFVDVPEDSDSDELPEVFTG